MALPIDLSERTLRWYVWFGRRALSEARPAVRGSTISIGRLRSSKVTMRRVLLVPTYSKSSSMLPGIFFYVQVPLLNVRVAQILVVAHREIQRAGCDGGRERVVEEQIGSAARI